MLHIIALNVHAIKATPFPVTIIQNDSTELTIRLHGNEFFHYKTTLDGYLIKKNRNGIYNYATVDKSDRIIPTEIKARNIEKRTTFEHNFTKNLKKNIQFSSVSKLQKSSKILSSQENSSTTSVRKSYPLTGQPKSIVILVNFKDLSFVTPDPKTAFTNLLNEKGYAANGATGSARDYFRDNSIRVFDPEFDVVGPYTLPETMAFYGKNLPNEDDSNPEKMVIDACNLAFNNGIDFTKYDTDNDGFIDNVFVYYAGHNEAEGGADSTIWPHRWNIGNTRTKFNEKILYDYACTSELRSNAGNYMCGIGTFVHEFGHVLGLPDYYATNQEEHHTLSNWSTMDGGAYLNAGRTPPAYSAYDRFFLGWLKPTELKMPNEYILENLATSNTAYIISQNGNHNLIGTNPLPKEFFTLENRQNEGWDRFLPGHGMLISRIYYNENDWLDNVPNNSASSMGVDIIEADRIANDNTLNGDPFPGVENVSWYTPTLRDNTKLTNKSLSLISENDNIISFVFMEEFLNSEIFPPTALKADNNTITTGSFTANWTSVSSANGYYLTVYNITNGVSQLTEGFDNGEATPTGWKITTKKRTTSKLYSGKSVPAVQLVNSSDTIITEKYILPVSKLTFFIRSLGGINGQVLVEGNNDENWIKLDSIPVDGMLNQTKVIDLLINNNNSYTQFRFTYKKGYGDVVIDDITAHFSQNLEYNKKEFWTTENFDTLSNLKPNGEYFYKVRSSKKVLNADQTILFEQLSDFSNLVSVNTLINTIGNVIRIQKDGTVKLLIPTTNLTVRVYNTLGQQVKTIHPLTNTFNIEALPKGQIYIIVVGEHRAKIRL